MSPTDALKTSRHRRFEFRTEGRCGLAYLLEEKDVVGGLAFDFFGETRIVDHGPSRNIHDRNVVERRDNSTACRVIRNGP